MADRSSLFERAWTETVETLVFNHLSFDLRVAVLRALHDRHFWSSSSGQHCQPTTPASSTPASTAGSDWGDTQGSSDPEW